MGALGTGARLAIAFVCGSGLVAGQSMLEYALGAANGTAAGVAGKPLGEGIGKVFGKLKQAGEKATLEEKRPRQETLETAEEQAPGTVAAPRRALRTRAAPTSKRAGATAEATVRSRQHEPPGEALLPPHRTITRVDLAAVAVGAGREDVVARLGRPAARVLIPEEGCLREVFLYSAAGEHLGRVVLTDGAVQAINVER